MLPKVSAALSKFISPIASATSQQARRDQERDPNRRRGSSKREQPASDDPAPTLDPPSAATFQRADFSRSKVAEKTADLKPGDRTPDATPPKSAELPPLTPGQTLLQIMAALSLKKGISKILVAIAYRSSNSGQKSGSKARKGAVLDQKAE